MSDLGKPLCDGDHWTLYPDVEYIQGRDGLPEKMKGQLAIGDSAIVFTGPRQLRPETGTRDLRHAQGRVSLRQYRARRGSPARQRRVSREGCR